MRPDSVVSSLKHYTRIKNSKSTYDAIVLSYAGIKCLNLDNEISEIFSIDKIIPSAGQGIITLQSREKDNKLFQFKKINHMKLIKGHMQKIF